MPWRSRAWSSPMTTRMGSSIYALSAGRPEEFDEPRRGELGLGHEPARAGALDAPAAARPARASRRARRPARPCLPREPPGDRHAVHVGQVDVEQHRVGPQLRGGASAARAVGGRRRRPRSRAPRAAPRAVARNGAESSTMRTVRGTLPSSRTDGRAMVGIALLFAFARTRTLRCARVVVAHRARPRGGRGPHPRLAAARAARRHAAGRPPPLTDTALTAMDALCGLAERRGTDAVWDALELVTHRELLAFTTLMASELAETDFALWPPGPPGRRAADAPAPSRAGHSSGRRSELAPRRCSSVTVSRRDRGPRRRRERPRSRPSSAGGHLAL